MVVDNVFVFVFSLIGADYFYGLFGISFVICLAAVFYHLTN